MKTHRLTGVIPPIGTPLTQEDKVDVGGLTRLTRYLLDAGVHGIFANGSMGGFAMLSDAEQLRSIETVVEVTNGQVPVMAGLGEMSTSRAIPRAKEIARSGATHLSVLSPLAFFSKQEHLVRYFSDIAASVDLPIVLYDNPTLTKNPIHPETILKLRERIPSLVGLKESNQDCINMQRVLDLTKNEKDFFVLTGSEYLIFVGLQMGVAGCVGGAHNLCPRIAVDLYESFLKGDITAAREHQHTLTDVCRIFNYGAIWGGFEEALRYLGICERAAGEPYRTLLTSEEREEVHAILAKTAPPLAGRIPSSEPHKSQTAKI